MLNRYFLLGNSRHELKNFLALFCQMFSVMALCVSNRLFTKATTRYDNLSFT